MPRQYVLECLIDLPDDPHEMSEIISKTKDPWTHLNDALKASGVNFQPKSEIRTKLPSRKRAEHPGVLLASSRPAEAAE